jgi:hypothetical protein
MSARQVEHVKERDCATGNQVAPQHNRRRPDAGRHGDGIQCGSLARAASCAEPLRLRLIGNDQRLTGSERGARNPPAGERLRRISGFEPHTGERNRMTKRKRKNDSGHCILLPAHVTRQGKRTRRRCAGCDVPLGTGWPDFGVRRGG